MAKWLVKRDDQTINFHESYVDAVEQRDTFNRLYKTTAYYVVSRD